MQPSPQQPHLTAQPTKPKTAPESTPSNAKHSPCLKENHNLLHYATYFLGVGSLAFVAQADNPYQLTNAARDGVIAGGIAAGAVLSRDWYKARLNPSMAHDPTALIALFMEMLQAGRAQANRNQAQLKQVELLQTDLVSAMREFNDMLRLEPAEIEARLRSLQTTHLTNAFAETEFPLEPHPTAAGAATYVPPSTTVKQSYSVARSGFDA